MASLTYKLQKHVWELLISKYFFFESDFCTITPHFLNPISKMFCNFLLQSNMPNMPIEYAKTQTRFLSALGPETKEKIKLAKKEIRFDL